MKFSKEAQVARRRKPRRPRKKPPSDPESALQSFTDDYLNTLGIRFIRIPDSFWRFLHATAYPSIKRWFRWCFGGIADNTCFLPISDKYSLCLHLELKTGTDLHGRQKTEAASLPWQIAHTPEEVQAIVQTFQSEAEKLKSLYQSQSST